MGNNKNSKGPIIALIIVAVLFFAAAVVFGVMLYKSKQDDSSNNKKIKVNNEFRNDIVVDTEENSSELDTEDETDTEEDIEDTEEDTSDIFGEELDDEEDIDADRPDMTFVKDGYQFTVPGIYDMVYADSIDVVIYVTDVFQMKIAVVDGSYDTVMENPDELSQALVDAGGTVTQEVQEMELLGTRYAYYKGEMSGDSMFVVYTAAPEVDYRIGGQIVLKTSELTDEEILYIFAAISVTAEKTDLPDSTQYDVEAQLQNRSKSASYGETKEKSTIQLGSISVTHKVPDGFYANEGYDDTDYVVECFYSVDPRVEVNCALYSKEWYGSVEDYIDANRHLDSSEVETMDIEGLSVSYIVEKYSSGDKEYQHVYAGADLGDELYCVDAYVSDEDIDLSMETVRDFFILAQE